MLQRKIAILGIGTNVGKTIVASIITTCLQADYWKPIQTGPIEDSDSEKVRQWTSAYIFPEAYQFHLPVSPHHASQKEGIKIIKKSINLPLTQKNLVIEGCGGVLTPLNSDLLFIDLLSLWEPEIVLVVPHYLGSINHTLLTIEALHHRHIVIKTIIFNGHPYPEGEEIILKFVPQVSIKRLLPENKITPKIIAYYAKHWKNI